MPAMQWIGEYAYNGHWALAASYVAVGAETEVYVDSATLRYIPQIGPDIIVDGYSMSNNTAASVAATPWVLTANTVQHYLDTFSTSLGAPDIHAYTQLGIPITISGLGLAGADIGPLGLADYVYITMWGRWQEGQPDTSGLMVKAVEPLPVDVKSFRFFKPPPNTGVI